MNHVQMVEQERRVLRWGGLAGLLGGIFCIVALVVVIAGPVGMEEPTDLVTWVTRFPDIKTARVLENLAYLMGLVLGVPLFLALYRALRRTSLAAALFGCGLGIVGLVAMMAAATPHAAHARLFSLYAAPGATAADQATIVLLWQAIWGIVDMLTYVGFFVVPAGLILLGVGMLRSPDFGRVFGGVSVVLGVVGLATAVLQLADPASMFGLGSYLAIVLFYFVAGWKLYRVSRAFRPEAVSTTRDLQVA